MKTIEKFAASFVDCSKGFEKVIVRKNYHTAIGIDLDNYMDFLTKYGPIEPVDRAIVSIHGEIWELMITKDGHTSGYFMNDMEECFNKAGLLIEPFPLFNAFSNVDFGYANRPDYTLTYYAQLAIQLTGNYQEEQGEDFLKTVQKCLDHFGKV